MAYLQILKGTKPGRIELESDRTVLGRSPECEVVLDTGAVSRQHAQILRDGESHTIEDMNSRNGTYVNGNRITGPAQLADDARIKICDYLFAFHSTPSQSANKQNLALLVTEEQEESAAVMSTLDATTSSGTGLVAEVRPEVKLRAILEINRSLGSVLSLDEVLPKMMDSSLRYSKTIVKQVMEKRQAILLADASSDSQFNMSQSIADFKIRSIMCVPLLGQDNKPLGIIQIHTEDRRHQFTQEDLDVLMSVAGMAGITLENARLHENLVAQERMKREVQLAAQVQRGFLPRAWPEIQGYGFYAFYEAAYEVGGDYYGFIELPDKRWVISLGDVSGKGMPAALMMAHLASDIRFSAISVPDAAAAVQRVNHSLGESGLSDKFVTLLYLVLDPVKHTLAVVNCGHMPPMVRKPDGELEEISPDSAGLPLNVSPDIPFECATVSIEPGWTVLLYTDGVSEAMNPAGDLFEMGRLREAYTRAPADPVKTGEVVIRAVRTFAAGRHQSDDITLICFGRLPV
ncbi:MAG: SpoIIE family protein phosphatase [Planctomycetes bacterium]|nr:SpoIIE family protein phosphatase [Planctomycetota bacterium]